MKRKTYRTILTIAKASVRKGVHNPHQLHLRTGISVPRAQKLWRGKGKISLADIDRICDSLSCNVHDLFKRVPIEE